MGDHVDSDVERMQRHKRQALYASEKQDYISAYRHLLNAYVIYQFNPDGEQGRVRMTWRDMEPLLERFEREARQQEAAKGGGKIMARPLTYSRPGACTNRCV